MATVTRLPTVSPPVTIVLDGDEASLLMECLNKASTTSTYGLGSFATTVYSKLKRLGVQLPFGHPSRGRE